MSTVARRAQALVDQVRRRLVELSAIPLAEPTAISQAHERNSQGLPTSSSDQTLFAGENSNCINVPSGWGHGPYLIQEGVTRAEWSPPSIPFKCGWSKDLRSLSFLQDVVREVLFAFAKFDDGQEILRLRPTEEMIKVFCEEDPLLSEWLQPQSMGHPVSSGE